MKKLSYRYKIIILLVTWLLLVGILFGYVFGWLKSLNEAQVQDILAKKKEQLELQEEQRSYQLATIDLEELEEKQLQPAEFFSKDTTLVKEIKTLEDFAALNGIQITTSISGTVTSLKKAQTSTELLIAPYTVVITGSYNSVLAFIHGMEYMGFITHIKQVSMQSVGNGDVSATLSSQYFIRK